MSILCDPENWVPWSVLHAEVAADGDDAVTAKLPAAATAFDALPPQFQRIVTFAAEWMFIRTGQSAMGPCTWRYEPTHADSVCDACPGHHWPESWAEWRRTGRCPARTVVELGPGMVVSIDEVQVDEVVVDPGEYSLVDNRWLVRVDGTSWPSPPTEWNASPTLRVDYIAGAPVPEVFASGARELAAHLVFGALGDRRCKLPPYWQSVTRDGFTVTARQVSTDDVSKAFTGISPLIDQTLALVSLEDGSPHPGADVGVPGRRRPPWRPRVAP